MFIFETFPVYQHAQKVYKEIIEYLKKNTVDRYVSDQLRRAMLSVVLNIAEGSGKYSSKEKKRYYLIARGSVYECVALTNLLEVAEADRSRLAVWKDTLLLIHKMLSGMVKVLMEKIKQ